VLQMTAFKNFRLIEWYLQLNPYYAYSNVIFVTVPEDVVNT
jgi:hypothetical protein